MKARDRMREVDRNNEVTLRKKYHLFDESDFEANNNKNNLFTQNHNSNINNYQRNNGSIKYQDLSLPNTKRISQDSSNLPDSAKLQDLNAVAKHKRTSSDTSKDKKAGDFVHVKHKRKAPPPPLDLSVNTLRSSTPKSTGRKKRQAPKPPVSPTTKVLEEAASATSLLEDREIRAIIEGTLTQNNIVKSTEANMPSSPKMEHKRYVSPYLKIREDRKLTDEQKRILLEQVSKSHRKSENQLNSVQAPIVSNSNTNTFSIEKGQLVYQRAESPKITKDEKDKIFAPSSPISPRPWYKRSSVNNSNYNGTSHKETIPFKKEVFLRTMEKRKKKDERDLPEVGYSRNSFFESASKFNIFARLTEDSAKKKEKDAEKRRSIGIPNISELDREAAQIIQQREQEASKKASQNEFPLIDEDESEEGKSTKDLITKFEAQSSNTNRITINTDFVARDELFGPNKKLDKPIGSNERKKNESPSKSKLPVSTNGTRKVSGLMALWTCPYCTLTNPNWKIICEACEKIKPYEKRYNVNDEINKKMSTPPAPRKFSYENVKRSENPWEMKTEIVKKYFQPSQNIRPGDLSKSASETFIANSFLKKSPSPTRRYLGSPKFLPRKMSVEKPDAKISAIAEDISENETKINDATKVIVQATKTFDPPLDNRISEGANDKSAPDLNAIRSIRLARFNTSLDMKKNQSEVEKLNVATNRKQSPEKHITDKLDFSDPIALEREKVRLREKIRAMNSKAMAEKYPILKRPTIVEEENSTEKDEKAVKPSALPIAPSSTCESSANFKLGAIKKILKKPTESQSDTLENEAVALEEKIINQESKLPEKRDKISTSVQTNAEIKMRKKSEELVPLTVVELIGKNDIENEEKSKEVSEIKIEIPSVTIKLPGNTNTIAINRILRNLENAIVDGKHDEAAQFAKDLAKLKLSLSVTRQKDRPISEIDLENSKVK